MTAMLTSDALIERGDPFEQLGPLQVAPVTYADFGPSLFEVAADGLATNCTRLGVSSILCDVSDGLRAAVARGSATVKLRLQFATMSDNDGEPDLALFFLSDSNTNEPAIFSLELSSP